MISHAIPIEIRIPVTIVGIAASNITVNVVRNVLSSRVRMTLIQSVQKFATPKAVLVSIGHNEQTKITKSEVCSLSAMMNRAIDIKARGDMDFSI